MRIITRAEWGARKPKSIVTVNPMHREWFVVHHSGASAAQSVRSIQDWCMDEPPDGRGFSDIDYNFLVRSGTGEIYEGRGWNVVGSHTIGYNTSGIGVCVIGNNPVVDDKTAGALAYLYGLSVSKFGRPLKVRGHGQLTGATECPGDRLRAFIAAGMPAPRGEETMGATLDALAEPVPYTIKRIKDRGWSELSVNGKLDYLLEAVVATGALDVDGDGDVESVSLQARLQRVEEMLAKIVAAIAPDETPTATPAKKATPATVAKPK